MKTLSVFLLTSTLTLAACGGAGMRSYEPVHQKTQFDQEQLFGAAQRSIEKLGYFPTKLDRASYSVSTREKEVGYSSVPRLSYKYSYTIETRGGDLRIVANCTMNSSVKRETFDDCGEDRPKQVIEEMEVLREKILELAKSMPRAPKFDEPAAEEEAADDAPAEQEAAAPDGKKDAKKDATAQKPAAPRKK
jgi:hypothetical protein